MTVCGKRVPSFEVAEHKLPGDGMTLEVSVSECPWETQKCCSGYCCVESDGREKPFGFGVAGPQLLVVEQGVFADEGNCIERKQYHVRLYTSHMPSTSAKQPIAALRSSEHLSTSCPSIPYADLADRLHLQTWNCEFSRPDRLAAACHNCDLLYVDRCCW